MSIKSQLPRIDYRWRTKCGLQARLFVTFIIIIVGFLIMLLFECFHPKRPKKPIKKQVYAETGVTTSTVATTKPLIQKYNRSVDSGAVTKKTLDGSKKKEAKKKAAIRSRQMRAMREERLRKDRERREAVSHIFQDIYPSDSGGVIWA